MESAVVKIAGGQYRVNEGDEIVVDRLSPKDGEEIIFDQVLWLVEKGKTKIGCPLVKGAKVTAKVIKHFLGEKQTIAKFKAKIGYRRRTGFRPRKTLVKIEKIAS